MKLDEILQICLLALQSRYPKSVVECNEAALNEVALASEPITAVEVLEVLQGRAPHLLQASARLVIDDQRSEIYLLNVSEETPAFWVYCGGHSPRQGEKQCQRVERQDRGTGSRR